MNIIKTLVLLVILALGGLAAYASQLPDQFEYSRNRIIAAPADAIFAQANDLKNFNGWSPWATLDPNAKIIISGPATGVGATMEWEGNSKIGKGSMTITEVVASQSVTYNLLFEKPMKSMAASALTFAPDKTGGTNVTWTMSGHSNLVQKMIGVVMNCEAMIDAQFDQGLTNLAAKVEHPIPGVQ